MSNISFTVLGSSSGMPQANRLNSGYVLDTGGSLFQFDCGGGVSHAFRKAGFNPLDVEAVFISHTHPDHISDLPLYIQMNYLAGRKKAIDLYLPEEAMAATKAYFRVLYILEEKLPFEINFIPVTVGAEFEINSITVKPVMNYHLKGYRDLIAQYNLPHQMQCFSYLIKAEGKSILYSADLGSEKDLFPFLKNLDLLVIESTHIDIANLLDAIIENKIGKIVLTHIDDTYDLFRAIGLARINGVDNLVIAEDGMKIDL